MKISIVTVVYNAEATLEGTIQSVMAQDYPDLEYIVVDGKSTDGTLAICERYRDQIDTLVSEPDKGIFDAMNKGIALAKGDFIGILNADDLYAGPEVISAVARQLSESGAESLYGDLVMVKPDNLDKIVRYYSAKDFELARFEKGDMPPHPTFFVHRSAYERFGNFKLNYKIVADYELMLRFLYVKKLSTTYLPMTMIRMRTGGNSSFGVRNTVRLNAEIKASLQEHHIPTSTLKIYSKYFTKALQLLKRPKD